jgi:hypothetical protein
MIKTTKHANAKHANANVKHAKPKPKPKAKSGLTALPEKTLKKIVNRLDKLLKLLPKRFQKK